MGGKAGVTRTVFWKAALRQCSSVGRACGNADGVPDFEALQRSDKEAMQTFWAFDLLKSGQEDQRARALVERKARLAKLIGEQKNPHLRYVEHNGRGTIVAGIEFERE